MSVAEGRLIKAALGDDWDRLPECIRQRFAINPSVNAPLFYEGMMTEIRASKMGKLLAFFAQCIGAPLLPYSQENVPIKVKVSSVEGSDDVVKERTYYFTGKKPLTVNSRMSLNANGEFLECVGAGLSMQMRIYAEAEQLHFKSEEYRWCIGQITFSLPLWLTPGESHIVHTDGDDGSFSVRITMTHPWFGLMFLQDGVFNPVQV